MQGVGKHFIMDLILGWADLARMYGPTESLSEALKLSLGWVCAVQLDAVHVIR